MFLKPFCRALAGAGLLCLAASAQAALTPVPLHLDVPVSDIGTDNNLMNSNTSRKLAVAADGTVYALFRSATNGIRIAKSVDRGQSFSASVQVAAADGEAEIAVAADGDLHVVYITGITINHVLSHDGGASFSTPVTVGTGSTAAHMAVDGDRVYIVPQNGSALYRSADDGQTFASTSTGSSYAFADLFVDPLSHEVLVIVDNPNVYFFKSTDFGQTLSAATATGKSVYYSVGGLSITGGKRYLFLAGSNANLERIEVDTPAYFTGAVNATAGSTTRSLSADVFGNVVSGYLDSGTNDLKFEHSNDLAATFGAATTVVTAATRANAAINTTNGDVLFLYEKANQVYLSTYKSGLIGYDITVSPSALSFPSIEAGTSTSLPVTLENVSASPVTVNTISGSTGFSVSHDCGASIAAGASCTVTVTFSPSAAGAASGTLSLDLAGNARSVSLSGTATPARTVASIALAASTASAVPGDSLTLTATVTGSNPTGTVDFLDNGAAIASCAAVALTAGQAECVVADLESGSKSFSANYSGDVANRSATSATVAVSVLPTYTVTPNAGAHVHIVPGVAQTVVEGQPLNLTVTADAGYSLDAVTGCGGTLSGNTYAIAAVTANCAVSATALPVHTVTVSAGANGNIAPNTLQNIVHGKPLSLTVTPAAGYGIASVTGCGGSLSGTTYSIPAVTADCAVSASFAKLNQTVDVNGQSSGGGGALAWLIAILGVVRVCARRVLPVVAGCFAFGTAQAAESSWYVGGLWGQVRSDVSSADVAADLTRAGFAGGEVSVDNDSRDAYRVFGGYRLTPNWSVELGYADLGEASARTTASVPVGLAQAYAQAVLDALPTSAEGVEASLGYHFPVTRELALSARAGLWRWDGDADARFGSQKLSNSREGTDAVYGLGADWAVNAGWTLGFEADRYRVDGEDLDLLGLNLKFAW